MRLWSSLLESEEEFQARWGYRVGPSIGEEGKRLPGQPLHSSSAEAWMFRSAWGLSRRAVLFSDYVSFHCHNDVNGFEAVIVPRGLTTGQQKKGLILFNAWLVFQTV